MNPADLLPPEILHSESDPVLDFETDLEVAARALDLEPWVLQRLKHPEREITVNLPLTRDDGSTVNVTGFRVQHSRTQGPSIGPVVLSPKAHTASLRITAAQLTLQSALLGLRLGGAAGAIVVDPAQFSERELRHLVKDYVFALRDNTGPLLDVLALPGNHYIVNWMEEAIAHARGQSEPAAVVGKHISPEDGTLASVWADATVDLAQHALGRDDLDGLRVAVQGFGRRGLLLANLLHFRGAKVTAIADRSGAIIRENGIDTATLESHVREHEVVYGFSGATAATNADLLESNCDLLILAAAERQVGRTNAHRIRARAILEITSGAVTAAGEASLPDHCLFIPQLLAGAPQLCVWSHEWQRGLSYADPEPQQASTEANALTLHAFDRVREMGKVREVSLRQAGLMLAAERLATSLRRR